MKKFKNRRIHFIVILFSLVLLFSAQFKTSAQESWFQTGQEADIVLGPYADSGGPSALHHPSRVCVDSTGRLFVADTRNNRILIWNTIPTTNYQPADVVVGQPDMYSNDSGGGSTGLNWPVGVYSDGTRLFVADANNNRALIWNSIPAQNGQPADIVVGQPDFNSYEYTNCAANTLRWPWDVFFDGQHFYVVSTGEARTLIWNSLPTENGQPADVVVGQPDFGAGSLPEPSAATLGTPRGVTSDGTYLAICDYNFHRILIWSSIPTQNGESADVVLFQSNFTTTSDTYSPMGIFMYGQKLFAANDHHICAWNNIPTINNQSPDYTIGRSDMQPGLSAEALSGPWGVSTDGTRLFVSDTNNNRVLIYDQIPSGTDISADVVLGQEDFNKSAFLSSKGIRSVSGVASSGHHLFLATQVDSRIVIHDGLPTEDCAEADYILSNLDFDSPIPPYGGWYQCSQIWTDGSRLITVSLHGGILMWDTIPESSQVPPDRIISSTKGCSETSLNTPGGVTSDGTRLFVSDTNNHRVLIWNTIPAEDGIPADIVLGQPDFNSSEPGLMYSPSRIATDGTRLAVADMEHNRVLIWNTIPTQNNQSPDIKLWDGSLYLPWKFGLPQGVFIFDDHLFVADGGGNRVLIWNTFPTTENQSPDVILGQPDSMTIRSRKARDGLHVPLNIWFDGDYLWVGEFKFADRVLGFRASISQNVPEAPSSLSATAASSHQIDLTWFDNASNEQGFKLERKTGTDGTYAQIVYLSANTLKYSDTRLSAGTQYYYRIKAYNRNGDSNYSDEADAATSDTNNPPNTPNNPSPDDGDRGVDRNTLIRWEGGDPDLGDAVTYDVYLDTVNPPTYCVASNLTKAEYLLPTLGINIYYYWKIKATDLSGATTEGPVWSFETHNPEGQYNLTLAASTGGTTYPRPSTYKYLPSDSVLLTAIPDTDYSFSGWTGDVPSEDESKNPLTLTMDGDKSITANFSTKGSGDDEEEDSEKKGTCFIATAAYGSPSHPYVRILQDFRDKYLMSSKFGRGLVNLYYKYSPFVADIIAKHKLLKDAVRALLLPLVAFSYSTLHSGLPDTTVMFVFIFVLPIIFILILGKRLNKRVKLSKRGH